MNYFALDELLMNYLQRAADTHNRPRMRQQSCSERDYVSTEPQRYTVAPELDTAELGTGFLL